MDNNQKEALRWYKQGCRDSRTAQKNHKNGDFEVACFLYQQAAEKILKAFLYLQGERLVIGHSALLLAKKCFQYSKKFSKIYDACRELDVFYIPTRYPNGIPDGLPYEYFTKIHSKRAEAAYSHIYNLVKVFFDFVD